MKFAWLLLTLVGCDDPVRAARIDALGPEEPDVAQGPLHRPGQPCVLCHDGTGPRAFSIGGTVYHSADSTLAVAGVRVELTDSAGIRFVTASNCAGNFFVEPADFTPVYPLRIALQAGEQRIEMDSPVQRDGSCASCHARAPSAASAGVVYLYEDAALAPTPQGCP